MRYGLDEQTERWTERPGSEGGEGNQASMQDAQRGCRIPILGEIQKLSEYSLRKPVLGGPA